MFFKRYTIYENKLSEQLSDDNPLKQKIIEMETPTDKHPIYSFLTIGLLIYIWIFQIVLMSNHIFGAMFSFLPVVFSTICLLIFYKKTYLTDQKQKYYMISYLVLFVSIFFSIFISSTDSGTLSFSSLAKTFLFFVDINKKSYIALSVLSFLNMGIVMSYYESPYKVYQALYSETKTHTPEKSFDHILNFYLISSIIIIILTPSVLDLIFNPSTDGFNSKLKSVSLAVFLTIPIWLTITFVSEKYILTFKKAKKLDTNIF